MKLLETTSGDTQYSSMNATSRVKFMDNPYSFSMMFQSSSSYITINGNQERCGSSFSDSDSSFMVSVDMAGINNVLINTLGGFVGGNLEMGSGGGGGGAWGSKEKEEEGGGWMVDDGLEWVGVEGDDENDVVVRFLDDDIF